MHTNITKNPRSKSSSYCIVAEGEAGVFLKKPEIDPPYDTLPHVFYNTLAQVLSDPGVYTWMILVEDNGSKTFVAAKTLTSDELHSKHYDLYEAYGQKPVILAGEMMVDAAKNVKYNFLSGTFMETMRQENPSGYDETKFQNAMQSFLLGGGAASVEFSTTESFIPSGVASRDALRMYKDVGYDILKFNTVEECNTFVKNERVMKQRIELLKKQYEFTKRMNPKLVKTDMNTYVAEQIAANPPYRNVKQPRNYFAEGGFSKYGVRKARTRRSGRRRSSKTRKYRR